LPSDVELRQKIAVRAERIFKDGLLDETRKLVKKYGQKAVSGSAGIAYRASLEFLSGRLPKDEAIEFIKNEEWKYVRRQRTWFRRNKFIQWFDSPEVAFEHISKSLNK